MKQDKLWTASYCYACTGNFLLFFAFYLLLPVLPMYLMETFQASHSMVGVVLSCYTLAALLIRPFSAFVLDNFARKPIYLLAYLLFINFFGGYALATGIMMFIVLRTFHGLAFGLLTTASNTLIIDIMPSSRRGEGLGYFGISNNLAMTVGPMTGLFLHDATTYENIFYICLAIGFTGFFFATMIKAKCVNCDKNTEPLSWDRFFLFKGVPAGISLLLLGIPYAMATSYTPIYGREVGLDVNTGYFFSLMAAGLIMSRLFAGKLVDRGKLTQVIVWGILICLLTFCLFSSIQWAHGLSHSTGLFLFHLVAMLMGIGYGMMFPAFNTLFVNLAENNRRATASSTYMTSWDVGIGIGLVAGGRIAEMTGTYTHAFAFSTVSILLSAAVFVLVGAPHYHRNKLR
ncbi:MAG: MFS transporter [Prevotellaceae bacterium]|nr:MFS transporter [Prevotellaceae bacterium]